MSSIDHPAWLSEDTNVDDTSLAVTTRAPEEKITSLGLSTRDVLAHLGGVLCLSSAGYNLLVGTCYAKYEQGKYIRIVFF